MGVVLAALHIKQVGPPLLAFLREGVVAASMGVVVASHRTDLKVVV